jgi:outer membrane lipoprotein carrier protein
MKKLALLFLSFALLAGFSVSAQTSKEILDKLSAKAKGYKSITSDFSSTLVDKKNGKNVKQDGTIKIKGSKYALSLSDYIVISDAKTVWSYDKKGNSCSIDDIADVKDGAFDPSQMFTIWEKDFKHEMKNTAANVDGAAAYEINLYPNNAKNKPYHTITMYVDKAKMEVVKIVVKTRENAEITYKVKSFKTTTDIPDSEFSFNKTKYPGVEMVDNRL